MSVYNRVYVSTATIGTGSVTPGAKLSNAFLSFADANGGSAIPASTRITYELNESQDFEIGEGVWDGTVFTRATVFISSIAGVVSTTKMVLTGAATVRIVIPAEEMPLLRGDNRFLGSQSIGPAGLAPDSPLTINVNTGASVAPSTGTNLHLVGADAVNNVVAFDSYGAFNSISARRANGTMASKSVVTSGDILFNITASGWDAAAYNAGGALRFVAAQTWTSAPVRGTYLSIYTTPIGGASGAIESVRFQPSGGLSIGAAAIAADPGIGSLSVSSNVLSNNSGLFNPASNDLASFQASGAYGGGLVFKDGTSRTLLWLQNLGANFFIGVGGTSSGVSAQYDFSAARLAITGGLRVTGVATFAALNSYEYAAIGAGSWYDTSTTVNRFFVGTDSGTDNLRIYATGFANNALVVNGATGTVAFNSATTFAGNMTGGQGAVLTLDAATQAAGVAGASILMRRASNSLYGAALYEGVDSSGVENLFIGVGANADPFNPAQLRLKVNQYGLATAAGSYYNFGTSIGSTGYGFRDNSGTPQVKRSGGTWRNFSSFLANVLDFGAVGDGTTDDTAAINAAIAAAMTVYLPGPGSYKTTAVLSFGSARTLVMYGDGPGVSRILSTHSGDGILIQIDNTSATNMMAVVRDLDIVQNSGGAGGKALSITGQQSYPVWAGHTQMLVENVRICSSTASAATEKWAYGLYVKNISNPEIIGCSLMGHSNQTGTAIRVDNDDNTGGFVTFGLLIDRPLMNGWLNGIDISGSIEGIIIKPYEIVVGDGSAIRVVGTAGPGGRSNVVQVIGGDLAANGAVAIFTDINNLIVNGVDIYRYSSAVAATDTIQMGNVTDFQIFGNKIGTADSQGSNNLLNMSAVVDGTITGNNFRGDNATGGFAISGASSDIVVSGNQFKTSVASAQCWFVVNSTRVTINGNNDRGWTAQQSISGNTNFVNTNNNHY